MSKPLSAAIVKLASTGSNVTSGTVDPTAGVGVAAVVGSAFISLIGGTAILYLKTGAADTDWTPTVFGGQVSPAAITGTFNNYAPANLAGTSTLRQDLSGPTTLTGLTSSGGAAQGRMLIVVNISTNPLNILTLVNESASSTAGNRFSLPGNVDFVIASNSSVTLAYDGISLRWRISGQSTPIIGTNVYSFVFRPGCGVNAGKLFADWAPLVLALNITPGLKVILFDNTLAPCIVPTGTWNMLDTTWSGWPPGSSVEVQEGAVLPGLFKIDNRLSVSFSGATPPITLVSGDLFTIDGAAEILTVTGATGPLIEYDDTGGTGILSVVNGLISNGPTPVVRSVATGPALIVQIYEGNIDDDTLFASGGDVIVVTRYGSGASINETQTGATIVYTNQSAARMFPSVTATTNTVAVVNEVTRVNPTGGSINVTLPPAFNQRGEFVTVKNVSGSTNQITILPAGGDTIDNTSQTQSTLPMASTTLISDGVSNWMIQAATVVDTDTMYNLVYRPGVGTSSGNVFETWTELMDVSDTIQGIKQIQIDDSLTTPAVLDAGSWDFTNVILSGFPKAGGVDCEVPEGCVFTQCRRITNSLRLTFSGTTPVITDLDDGFTLVTLLANALVIEYGSLITTSGAGPFIECTGTPGNLSIISLIESGSIIDGTVPPIKCSAAGADLAIMFSSGMSRLFDNTIEAVAGCTVRYFYVSPAAGGAFVPFSVDQPGIVDPIIFHNLTRARMFPTAVNTTDIVAANNEITRVDPTAGPINITLPPALGLKGVACIIKKTVGATADDITILPDGADTIDGAASILITAGTDRGSLTMTSDGVSDWVVTASYP